MNLDACEVEPYLGASLDHKIPLCRGGTNKADNLVVCCIGCNMEKNNMTENEFVRGKQGVSLPLQENPMVTESQYEDV